MGETTLDQAVFLGDLDAHADEAAGRAFAEFLERLLVEVLRVRVQAGHHAGDGVGDELLSRPPAPRSRDLIMPNTAASCCSSSSGSGASVPRATVCSDTVVSAPASAPTAIHPAILVF
jgi:hypothetical protein